MTTVYFLRHGPAGDRGEWTGDDFDRPLTAEGKTRVEHEAAALAKLGLTLDVIVSSPLVRAYQTAEIVAKKLGCADRLVKDKAVGPGFGRDAVARILADHPKADAVMFVGHEPDFSETVSDLIGGGRIVLKKGGLACVELNAGPSLKGKLLWLVPPGVLAP